LPNQKKKLIFLHFETDQCQECNEVAKTGFASAQFQERLSRDFISFRVNPGTQNGRKLADKFDVKYKPASLFLDANGNILSRMNGSNSDGSKYTAQADLALSRRSGKQLSDYEKAYNAGDRSLEVLEGYMSKRSEALQPTDQILDEYVGKLPLDSLTSFRILKQIYSAGPTLDSRAYKVVQVVVPQKIIDNLYRSFSLTDCAAINSAIVNNSFNKAVKTKDADLALQAAQFGQKTYRTSDDYMRGSMAYGRNMMHFYYETRDTLTYFREVAEFLENTHMRMTADSLRKMDQKEVMYKGGGDASSASAVRSVVVAPFSQFFHMDLNEHAWHFFEMSAKADDLERALKWSYQSQEFFNELTKNTGHPMRLGNPAYIDTYAQILYKLGRKDEAIAWQTKAVEAQKITGNSAEQLETTLQKMKDGK
jgi:tetratricopeptide (TPR) repeat protein